jgi:type I restriction enzyme S subunit
MAVNEHVFLLRKKSDLIRSDFLFFYIFSDEGQEQIRRNYHGLIGGIKREDVLNLQIRVPPLFEQQKIAHVLRSVQEAKEKTETVIRTTKELKKSMMKHLFTYGPVSLEDVEKVELKETETGVVPKDWKLITIGEVFDLKQGKQLSDRESKTNKIQRPFLRTSNLFWGKISTSKLDLMYFTPEEFETLKLMKGDILVCEGGDIGRTALYQEDSMEIAYQNHLHRLRPLNDRIFNEFFVFWIDHAINQRGLYIHAANRTTIPNLSGSRLKGFFIPFPAVSIQMQISKVLVDINSKLEAEEAKKKALEELFKTLLRDLMTAKIRVKDLVINNA